MLGDWTLAVKDGHNESEMEGGPIRSLLPSRSPDCSKCTTLRPRKRE